MAQRRWTFVIVPHGLGTSRSVEVSTSVLKLAGAFVAAAVMVVLALGFATITRSFDLAKAENLERDNAVLAEEIGRMHGRLTELSDTLDRIARRDDQIRVLANLEPIDPQVQAAGIGGPRAPLTSTEVAATGVLGRQAEQVREDLSGLIRRANLLAMSFGDAVDSLKGHKKRMESTPSILPTQGWLSSNYSTSRLHPILNVARPHVGIDVTAPTGTPIEAPAAGRITFAGTKTGYGKTVIIQHGFGVETRFAHASKLLAQKGQRVKRGDRIGLVGKSGLATAPHLHYEVHVKGRAVNPLNYVLPETVTD
jgi:murein DD-endopeptidase MepM/ murein hydrolase activator NlpD